MGKTNAMRLLDEAGIAYREHEYDEEIVDGVGVALALGEDEESVFKTLIAVNDKGEHFAFLVPVNHELNLKKAAKASSSKSIEMIHLKELLPLTGYVHGGCSPIGLKKPFPVYVEETAQLYEHIFLSGGHRGVQIEMSPLELAAYCKAEFVSLVN